MDGKEDQGRKPADFESARNELSSKLGTEAWSANEALHDARDGIASKVGDYASAATQVLEETAEGAQRDVAASLKSLGGALRAASEYLAENDQQTESKFVLEASGGLDRLASSLKNKPLRDVLGEVQSFGRQNPGTLLAGSVLAGVALSRFVKSSSRVDAEKRPPPKREFAQGRERSSSGQGRSGTASDSAAEDEKEETNER